jgi:hypothetical protein
VGHLAGGAPLIGVQSRLLVFTQWTFSFLTCGRRARLISEPVSRPAAASGSRAMQEVASP